MKTMHWLGVITTTLISLNVLTACSGDDAPAAPGSTGGTTGAGGSGTAGTGTAGTGTAGSNMGVQLVSPAYHTVLTGADITMNAQSQPASYKTGACSSCHGENAEGNLVGPEIRFVPADYAKFIVRNGRMLPTNPPSPSGMAAVPASTVSDADLDTLIAWTNSFPKPTGGQGLYKAMCGNCHGPNMPTGGSAPISIQGASLADVDKYVRNGNGTDITNRKEYMPKYDTTLLTETELTAIKQYIGAK